MASCSCCGSREENEAHAPHAHDGHGHDHDHDHGHSHGGGDGNFPWFLRMILPGAVFCLGLLGQDWVVSGIGVNGFHAVMLAGYALCGWPVMREAGEAALRRDFFNEFTLMSAASLVAICLGDVTEALGVMLFYCVGEAVQERAAGRSRDSIRALLASKPQTARLMRGGEAVDVPPEEVGIGSSILVKPGDMVPLDGVVLSGGANMDMSSLTGEAAPAAVGKGGTVYSGAICLDGSLVVETTARAADSMAGKILAMVENAAAAKSRTERFITVFARRYTRAVATAAVLVALLPPLAFGQPWETWVYRSLVLLVVSCPCALFLSVPLAFFAGIGSASRHGVLVKGGQVFDALARAGTVVFDKTGTLTRGRLSLSGAEPAPGVGRDELVRLAAVAESRSNHPVAAAVVAALAPGTAVPAGVSIRDVAGKGIVAAAAEGEILVGNAALLRDHAVEFAETSSPDIAVHVALNGRYAGCLLFADRVKPDSAAAVAALRERNGVKLYMLTGDREETASRAAAELGLDGFRAGLLPDGKVAALRELSPGGDAVFVGDGVNDAPVLAAAGVGVAMGALGSAAAVEAADAVILDDSVARLPALFAIAARTRRIAGENIVFALGVKAVIMVLGILGISGLWAAVFADVGVALLAVLNSLRLTVSPKGRNL